MNDMEAITDRYCFLLRSLIACFWPAQRQCLQWLKRYMIVIAMMLTEAITDRFFLEEGLSTETVSRSLARYVSARNISVEAQWPCHLIALTQRASAPTLTASRPITHARNQRAKYQRAKGASKYATANQLCNQATLTASARRNISPPMDGQCIPRTSARSCAL